MRKTTKTDLLVVAPQLGAPFHAFASAGQLKAIGGIAVLVRRSWVGPDAEVVSEFLVAGRISRTVVCSPSTTFVFWNVHNFNLDEIGGTAA